MADKKILSKDLSHETLRAICRLKPTLADCAAFFNVSEDTIIRRCKEFEGLTFAKFRDKHMVDTRLTLVRNALKMANNGNTALMIFCLKNLNKWQDKIDIEVEGNVTTNYVEWAKSAAKQIEEEDQQALIDVAPKKIDE